jgi:hypothetical protein
MPPSDSDSERSSRRSYRLTSDLADELSLSENQLVRANVVSSLPDNPEKLIVNIRGKKVVAKSELDVRENQTLLVRVVSLGSPIELKLLDPYDAPEELRDGDLETFLEQNELSHDEDDVDLLREWLDQELPLDENLLRQALSNDHWVRGSDGGVDGDKLWAMTFLRQDGFPVNGEMIECLGAARDSNHENDLAMLHRSPGTEISFTGGDVSIQDSVQSIGFDVVRQFSRRPHQASQTLHSSLLRSLRGDESSDTQYMESVEKRLLGLILGVALMNLRTKSGFRIFYPVVESGRVRMVWLKGYCNKKTGNWSVSCQLKLTALGRLEASVVKENRKLSVVLRSTDQNVLDKIKNHSSELVSALQTSFEDVTVTVENKAPGSSSDPFKGAGQGYSKTKLSFNPGLDVTA